MTYPVFPTTLPLGWSVKRTPKHGTTVAMHASGRSVRRSLYQQPLFSFELTCEGLSSSAAFGGIPANSKQTLEGFFTDQAGQYGLFYFTDPNRYSVTLQSLGTGTGAQTTFTATWTLGSYSYPVGGINPTGVAVYSNGTLVSASAYTISGNTIVFNTAPVLGAVLTATYSYYFLCAFDKDELEFEEFMSNLHSAESILFTSVKP